MVAVCASHVRVCLLARHWVIMDSNIPPEFAGGASGMMLAGSEADERVTFEGGIISISYRFVIVPIPKTTPNGSSGANRYNVLLLLLHRRQKFFDRVFALRQNNKATMHLKFAHE
jgi:hypothetical protein